MKMQSLFFLFFLIILGTLYQHANAETGCTDVTVNYKEPVPKDPSKEIVAGGGITRCNQPKEHSTYAFHKPNETISLQNDPAGLGIRESDHFSSDLTIPLKGSPVRVDCTYDKYEYFKGCKIVR